jgi:hypothetical protein
MCYQSAGKFGFRNTDLSHFKLSVILSYCKYPVESQPGMISLLSLFYTLFLSIFHSFRTVTPSLLFANYSYLSFTRPIATPLPFPISFSFHTSTSFPPNQTVKEENNEELIVLRVALFELFSEVCAHLNTEQARMELCLNDYRCRFVISLLRFPELTEPTFGTNTG